ncbi:MAG: YmdB family metallophosphoesterase, partial [Planctomycetota bacterium]
MLRILFLGDIVGRPGMQAVTRHLMRIRGENNIDAVIVNAENAADGSGLTVSQYRQLIESGVDGITLGDHIYRRNE